MEMAKIKPPKKKEEPPPIPKFVPLKPNLELLNAPLGQKPAAASTEQPKTDKPKPPAPAPVPAAPATIPTTVPTGGTTAGRLQTERQTSSESSSTESISSSAASSSISDNNKATPAQAEEEDEDEYEYYEYESYEEEEEEEPVPPPAPAPQPPKVEYQQQLKTQLFVYSDLLVLMLSAVCLLQDIAMFPRQCVCNTFISTFQPAISATNTAPKPPERKTSYSSPTTTTTASTYANSYAKPTTSAAASTTPSTTTTANSGIRSYGGAKTMPNIPAVTEQAKPAETPATEQNVSEMTSSITARYYYNELYFGRRKAKRKVHPYPVSVIVCIFMCLTFILQIQKIER